MKNITLSAQADQIEKARKIAERQHRSLNDLFRDWLSSLVRADTSATNDNRLKDLWRHAGKLRVGTKLTREEMNER